MSGFGIDRAIAIRVGTGFSRETTDFHRRHKFLD